MKPGKDILWSTDLFRPSPASGTGLPGVQGVRSPEVEVFVPGRSGPPPDPMRERAYLVLGRPAAQFLASRDEQTGTLAEIGDHLAGTPDFDFDELRRAMAELERRKAVEVVARDARLGNHTFRLTPVGRVIAA